MVCWALFVAAVSTAAAQPPPADEQTAPSAGVAALGETCSREHRCGEGAVCVAMTAGFGGLAPARDCADEPGCFRALYCDRPRARRALAPREGMLAFAARGSVHAVVEPLTEDVDYTGRPPRLLGHLRSELIVGRIAARGEASSAARALVGRELRISTADGGSCSGAVRAVWIVSRLRGAWMPGEEIEASWGGGDAPYRTAAVPAEACADPIFARAADLPAVDVVAPDANVPAELEASAQAAFVALAPSRLLERWYRYYRADHDGEGPAHWWQLRTGGGFGPEVRRFTVAGMPRVVVSAHAGELCEATEGSLMVVFRQDGDRLVVESLSDVAVRPRVALDVDGDGLLEIVGDLLDDGAFRQMRLVSPTLSTESVIEPGSQPC